jgi:hypothetical protein
MTDAETESTPTEKKSVFFRRSRRSRLNVFVGMLALLYFIRMYLQIALFGLQNTDSGVACPNKNQHCAHGYSRLSIYLCHSPIK